MKSLIVLVIVTCLFSATFFLYANYAQNNSTINPIYSTEYNQLDNEFTLEERDQLYDLVNNYRSKLNLNPFKKNTQLKESASLKLKDMFDKQYWSHNNPEGKPPAFFVAQAKYNYSHLGENLAESYFNPKDIIDAWIKSPSHNENLIRPDFDETGISSGCGLYMNNVTCLVVMHYASPK